MGKARPKPLLEHYSFKCLKELTSPVSIIKKLLLKPLLKYKLDDVEGRIVEANGQVVVGEDKEEGSGQAGVASEKRRTHISNNNGSGVVGCPAMLDADPADTADTEDALH
ncbi:hypothetical protein DFJ73DRAFT_776336 [Zopfochytrium polystomum]|nr:hypothetical protein DFJ73DRAFT_776336 [Zopfochytrium polystomum]